jgi:splicing factor U2AF subunit
VEEGPNKIFIGGLPFYLNEEQVKELLSSFGQLRSFNLVKDTANGNSKGFAFFEYLDPNNTDKACAGLNGMKLGEKTILVQRANVGAKHGNAALGKEGSSTSVLLNQTAAQFLNLLMPIPSVCAMLSININDPGTPTTVVQLLNMFSYEELLDDELFEDILDDILEEVQRIAPIVSSYVHRPEKPNVDDNGNPSNSKKIQFCVGRVFVEFHSKEDALKVQQALTGKKFNGRYVVTGFFSETRYLDKNFDPNESEEKASFETITAKQQQQQQQFQFNESDNFSSSSSSSSSSSLSSLLYQSVTFVASSDPITVQPSSATIGDSIANSNNLNGNGGSSWPNSPPPLV